MKRLLLGSLIGTLLVTAGVAPAWSTMGYAPPALTSLEEQDTGSPPGLLLIRKDCRQELEKIKTRIETFFRSATTIVKVLVNAFKTIVLSFVRLAARVVLTLAVTFAQWVLHMLLSV